MVLLDNISLTNNSKILISYYNELNKLTKNIIFQTTKQKEEKYILNFKSFYLIN